MRLRFRRWQALVMAGMFLMVLATLAAVPRAIAAGHSVTRIIFDPPTPNILVNGQNVTVSFAYSTTQPGGVRIFARPFSGGSPAPAYAASGAQVSPAGSGTGKQSFTITTGNVTVDQVRIQMFDAAQKQLLFEAFVPVHYEFRAP